MQSIYIYCNMNISKGGNKLVENQNGKNQTYYMQLDILQKLEQHKKETHS